MLVPEIERDIGIQTYATPSHGIGGVVRRNIEDFAVKEVLVDGSMAEIDSSAYDIEHRVLGSSAAKNRYLLCVLVKRNWDTFIAIKNVAQQLGIDMDKIGTAGIKDAKAVTAQHVTLEGVSIEEVVRVKVKDIEIRPIGYVRNRLSSYYLLGNDFHITIKAIRHSEAETLKRLTETVDELRSLGGVPNFYGYQRFGTTRPVTHLVGKAIVQGEFEKAAMLFLAASFPNEHPDSRLAREEFQSAQDPKRALKSFPKQLRYERLMLRRLAKKPDDFVGAFGMLPMKLQLLLSQAYQSYLFNRFLSERMASGLLLDRVVVGDYAVSVERSGLPALTAFKMVNAVNLTEMNEALKAGRMRLALPLIGFKQNPSQGAQGQIEKQILEKEGVTPEDFRIKSMPEVAAKGELRAVLTPIEDFSLEQIGEDRVDPSECEVRVGFMLYRGSYATIVLREIMKARDPVEAGF